MGRKANKQVWKAYKRVLRMVKMYDKGMTMEEIGDKFGISRQRVSMLFKEQLIRIDKLRQKGILK
jgi:DNA-directed RNA polymerase specialized sigma subunit